MFENQSYESLLVMLLDRVKTPGIAKQEGTFVYDSMSPVAIEMAIAYSQLDRVLRLGFAQTTTGEYLDRRAEEFGVLRKEATVAKGIIRIVGPPGTKVPSGVVFSTTSGTLFKTVSDVSIGSGGNVMAAIQAVEAGSGGNVPAGLVTQVPITWSGILQVMNDAPIDGGYNVEADDSLLSRLLAKVRNPATSGNVNHYLQWAREVQGVGDAKVFPVWNGPLTVKVVLLSEQKRAPLPSVVSAVTEYIESVRPIGAQITVVPAVETAVNISVKVTVESGANLAGVKESIEQRITNYLQDLAFKDNTIRYSQIANVVLDAPHVIDYSNLTLNGGNTNIVIPSEGVGVLGMVTVA
ncbi:baseplate J/gp47 family protein [Paenibacillus sp. N1-5-1-14]|uniref:baseplate J/gp47 family protein n=1 Tax=Paenibacillus radicibacter TaxID=2972488 RepID=UPI002158DD77|nr:baseplate J/gp47 family protein [Paenibacillus radicibacter]MCR8645591.1 baseplate J/gp47 family protein [Paenibacillus radicibacter]